MPSARHSLREKNNMKISTKGRYGVQIMLDIAKNSSGPVKIADICARQNLTVKYAEQLTSTLTKGGLLRSVRGAMGGYELVKLPSQYSMGEILRILEGDFVPVECISNPKFCDKKSGCGILRFWQGLYDSVKGYLDGVTLQDLIDEGSSADFYEI